MFSAGCFRCVSDRFLALGLGLMHMRCINCMCSAQVEVNMVCLSSCQHEHAMHIQLLTRACCVLFNVNVNVDGRITPYALTSQVVIGGAAVRLLLCCLHYIDTTVLFSEALTGNITRILWYTNDHRHVEVHVLLQLFCLPINWRTVNLVVATKYNCAVCPNGCVRGQCLWEPRQCYARL